ncbi:MAG: hypothetical protein VYC34_02280 [Planctomycetota bacterium]|nr:hypothetical protein [Planctomycetota bacterium]
MQPTICGRSATRGLTVCAAASALCAATAQAAPMFYFGEDLNSSDGSRLASYPNAVAARMTFESNLLDPSTIDFESVPTGTGGLDSLSMGPNGNASLDGGAVALLATGTDGEGRYPLSGDKFVAGGIGVTEMLDFDFDTPQVGFGLNIVDAGDFGGQLVAVVTYAFGPRGEAPPAEEAFQIPHTLGVAGNTSGSVLFWGWIDPENPITSVRIVSTSPATDAIGIDDVTASTQIPAPGAGVGLLIGLATIATRRRR